MLLQSIVVILLLGLAIAAILYYDPWHMGSLMWAFAGNSRTMAVAYSVQLLSVLEMSSVIDFTALVGAEHGARVASIMSIAMIIMRVVTGNLDFKTQPPPRND